MSERRQFVKDDCADYIHRVRTALANASSGAKRLEAIDALVAAVRDAARTDGDRASATDLEQALVRSLPKSWNYRCDETVEDANRLASLLTNDREDVVKETLLPIAKTSTNITFVQNLAHNVTAKVLADDISSEIGKSFCDQILANLASNIRKCCPFLDNDWRAMSLKEGDSSATLSWGCGARFGRSFTAQQFAAIVETCETVQSGASVNKMLGILSDISRRPNQTQLAFSEFLLPVLGLLPPRGVVASLGPYQCLFSGMMASYTSKFVPTEPKKIQDWSAPARGCSSKCADCKELDRFLTSIHESEKRFAMAAPRRKHLEQRLSQSGLEVRTDTRGSPHKLVIRKTRSIRRDDVESLQKTRQSSTEEIFRIGKDKLRSMLGEMRYGMLYAALGIPYTEPFTNDVGRRIPLADVSERTANAQQNKRGFAQAFDEKVDPSKRGKQGTEVVDLEGEE